MSYSAVAVPWTYPHQPAQALGDSGFSGEDKIIWYALFASPFIGAAVGYGVSKKHPIISTAAGMVLGPIVWWSLVLTYGFIGIASAKKP